MANLRIVALVSVGTVLVAGVACAALITQLRSSGSESRAPKVISSARGAHLQTVHAAGGGRYFVVSLGSVCLNVPGSVRLSELKPAEPLGGLQVTDFVVMPRNGSELLDQPDARIAESPRFRGTRTITRTCGQDLPPMDLYAEMFKPATSDAGALEYELTYVSDGREARTRVRDGFGMCERAFCDVLG